MLRYYQVFDIRDCDGIAPRFPDREGIKHEPSAEGEAVVGDFFGQPNAPHLTRDQQSNRACYSPALDAITVPRIDQFDDLAEYYSTLFHEMVHSTGHPDRLARFASCAEYDPSGYAREELVAEIGAAALLHRIGLETPASFRNSTAYIQNWLQALKNDKRFIVSAAGKADKAVSFILGEA